MSTPWFLPDLSLHPGGCPCAWCSQAAEARAARMRGRIAAGQGITAQAKREAAARAALTREMAGYGAYPYRTAREAAQEFLDGAVRSRVARKFCHEPGCGCGCEKPLKPVSGRGAQEDKPALTPEQEIRAELTAFDDWMLNGPRYPAWMERDEAEPGRCRECRLGHADVPGGLCLYCKLRSQVTREGVRKALREPDRKPAAGAVVTVTLVVLGCILLSTALSGFPALLFPGLVLMAAGTARAMKR
jgi:hypothetical protein